MLKLANAARYLPGVTSNAIVRCISSHTSLITNHAAGHVQASSLTYDQQKQPVAPNLRRTNHVGELKDVDRLLSRLSLSPAELQATLTFMLPGRNHGSKVPDAIVEPLPKPVFECPHGDNHGHVSDPLAEIIDRNVSVPGFGKVEKKAKNRITNEIHRRRRKMNHHRYKKWRKRMKFKLRQIKQKRRRRKQKKWERYLEGLRFNGLSQEEGEKYMKEREEQLKIFLRYLGFEGEAVKSGQEFKPRGIQYIRRAKKITRRIEEGRSGEIVPTPMYKKANSP